MRELNPRQRGLLACRGKTLHLLLTNIHVYRQACTYQIVLRLCLQMGRERSAVAMPGLKAAIPAG